VSQYQKGKTNLDFTEARDSEWQWHQLGHMHHISAPRSRQITTPAPHHSVFTGRMPFLPPNQQRQSTSVHTFTNDVQYPQTKTFHNPLPNSSTLALFETSELVLNKRPDALPAAQPTASKH